jgi:hypothetical protein
MSVSVSSFANQNWVITPVAVGVGQTPPTLANQDWLLVLSGVAIINLPGNNPNDWRRETLTIIPDIESPINFAITRYGLPAPGTDLVGLNLEQWAPFAAVSSGFEKESGGVDAGYAVDAWRNSPFLSVYDVNGDHVTQLFQGIDVDLAVRNNNATLYRVSFNITLLAKIVIFSFFHG